MPQRCAWVIPFQFKNKPIRQLSTKFGKRLIFMWPFIETNAAAMGTLGDCAASPSSMVI
jgi:hypothetical protein